MPSGYNSDKTPDTGWWEDQIQMAIEFRKVSAFETKWESWRKYYRSEYRSDVLPINVFFSMLRATVPRVYFRNPAVSVSPSSPGALNIAFAQLLNRIDNKLLRQMDAKNQAKAATQDAFLYGTGLLKVGFTQGAAPVPNPFKRQDGIPTDKQGNRLEYDTTLAPYMPWCRRVHPRAFLVENGCFDLRHARWVGHWMQKPKEDIENNPTYKNTENLPTTSELRVPNPKISTGKVDLVDLYEIRDMKTGQYLILVPGGAKGSSRCIAQGDDMGLDWGFPFFPMIFNPDNEVFWGLPDSQILEPYQRELNENNTLKMKHRRLSLIKLLVQDGMMDDSEIAKMLSEDVLAVVKTRSNPKAVVEKMLLANIPPDLFTAEAGTMQNVREVMGFSRNQAGEYQAGSEKVTAREVEEVAASSEIRVDERRDTAADTIRAMVECTNRHVFTLWDTDQVLEVVGPGGAKVWVQFNPSDLKNAGYHLRVDPDSGRPKSRQERELKAFMIYERLKANPMVDPTALTRFLLTELEGVEMDELMRDYVPGTQGANAGATSPGTPMPVQDYAGMIQKAMTRMGNAPVRPNLQVVR